MEPLRIGKITFDKKIKESGLIGFRREVLKKLNPANVLFHNHNGTGYNHNYPLVQCKRIKGNAVIICINEGCDQLTELFNLKDWRLKIWQRERNFPVINLEVSQYHMQVWKQYFHYTIFNWIPFNKVNFPKYQDLQSEGERIFLLENMLRDNMIDMANGIGMQVEREIRIDIQAIRGERLVGYKGIKHQAFDVDFKTNMFLPEYLGIGKGVSEGYGVVRKQKSNTNSR